MEKRSSSAKHADLFIYLIRSLQVFQYGRYLQNIVHISAKRDLIPQTPVLLMK